ncbi:MAG: LysR family transcriptional regulator [Paraglaciecola sp.]|uniref:LysR family transcriptional regulator n=1 Tax=Paraglaciecola sp. TaxID=1920173 RepID=UPI00329A3E9C
MTLEQIRVFITVAQLGSIAAAAETLHKTQSALSIALKRLQDELNIELFHRQQYRLSLTVAGAKLLRHCEYLVKQQNHVLDIAKHLANGIESKIDVIYETVCHDEAIFSAISKAHQRFPLTEFYLSSENNLRSIKRLIDGEGDIAISPWMDQFNELADFETLPFSRFKIIIAAHKKQFPKNEPLPKSVTELEYLPLLMPQSLIFQLDLERLLGFVSPLQIRTNDLWAQKAMLMNGGGWGCIPSHLIEHELKTGELLELKLEEISYDAYVETRIIKLLNHSLGIAGKEMWQTLASKAANFNLNSE